MASGTHTGQLLGYARVSTADQDPPLQLDALERAGVNRVFTDHASGTKATRPEWDELLGYAREGDVIVARRLDRVGRSLRNLIDVVQQLDERGIGLRLLQEQLDTSSASGRMPFHIMGSLSQFERDLLAERTNAGLAAARALGRVGGRKQKLTPQQSSAVRAMFESRRHTAAEVAAAFGVSPRTVYRVLDRAQ